MFHVGYHLGLSRCIFILDLIANLVTGFDGQTKEVWYAWLQKIKSIFWFNGEYYATNLGTFDWADHP